jgi:Ca2+-binding EF-hand superfamily protein
MQISKPHVFGVHIHRKVQLVPKFKEYDVDGNGYITLEEASTILQRPPFNFPASKVVFLLKRFDKDGNGKLDIEEFAGFYAEAKATLVFTVCV